VNDSPIDDTTDASMSSPQKGKLLVDTAQESSSASADISETEIASDWTKLAGLSAGRKSQETSRTTQVSHACQPVIYIFYTVVALEIFLLQIKNDAIC